MASSMYYYTIIKSSVAILRRAPRYRIRVGLKFGEHGLETILSALAGSRAVLPPFGL